MEGIKLKKLKDINVQEALAATLLLERQEEIAFLSVLKGLISCLFFEQTKIEEKGKKTICFFFTPSYATRQAYFEDFKNVVECADDSISFSYERKFSFSIKKVYGIILWMLWIVQLKKSNLSLQYRMYLALKLLSGYLYVANLERYLHSENIFPNLAVTFCDIHTVDYFITMFFKTRGVTTATLQHAIFDHEKFGWSYTLSRSTYFLGINEVAKNEAMLSGMNLDNFVVLGPLKEIKAPRKKQIKQKNLNVAGLALSGPVLEQQNEKLIEYAQKLIDENNYIFKVRFHPALEKEKYEKFMNQKMFLDESNSMQEFAEQCDFVIMGTTNTFGELISMDTYAFRMVDKVDFYKCIDDFKFKDYDTLLELLLSLKNKPESMNKRMRVVKDKIIPSWNIRDAYHEFFDRFI